MPPQLKSGKLYSKTFLGFTARFPCYFCECAELQQQTPTQVHHWPPKSMGGGRRRDDRVIPVCLEHHARCHGETVEGRPPIERRHQYLAVAVTRSRFMEQATDAEWEQFTRDRRRWQESRGLPVGGDVEEEAAAE